MTEQIKDIEKIEELLIYEQIKYEAGEILYIPQYDLTANVFEITQWKAVQYQENGGVLTLEGFASMPGAPQKQKVNYNVNIFQTRIFKDFEKAKHYLAHELSRAAFNISKGLKGLEKLTEPGKV